MIGALATVLEMLGLALVAPLITLLQEPAHVHEINILRGAYWLQRRFVRGAVVETTHRLQTLYLTAPYAKLVTTNRAGLVRNIRHSIPQAYFRSVAGAMNFWSRRVSR